MRYTFFIPLFIFFACNSQKQDKDLSSKIIPPDRFEEILYQVHLTDAVKDIHNAVDAENTYLQKDYYENELFAKYGITMELFEWNVIYYAKMKKIDEMYGNVMERYKLEKGELEKNKYLKKKEK